MMKRPWKILLIIVLLGMGCSPTDLLGDLIETPDLVMPDGQTGDLAYQDNAGDELVGDLSAEVDQWILDTSEVAEELDVGVQCQPGDGCFLDSCSDNSECQSGWCVEHMGEGVCTQACQEECPPGWTCQTTGGTGPDMMSICVSNFANLCKPCATTKGCESAGGAEDVCLDYGIEGSFCGGGCAADEDCPWGFLCQEADSIDGVTLKQCVAESGVCPCSQKSVELGLSTPCAVTSEFGTCPGKRVCIEDGLSDCDALVPGLEVCNGIDDNCDGDVDEASFVEGEYVNLCDDGNECTKDACKGEDGCANTALDGEECKDGNPCTVADLCIAGICVGSVVDCNDDNPCTDDACNDTGGCSFTPNLELCDDGDPCTVGDQCGDGECTGFSVPCDCQEDPDCAALEDGNLCNGTLFCDQSELPYKCSIVEESIVVCPVPEGLDAPCLDAICDAVSGDCTFISAHDGMLCSDGDKCTVGDFCAEGVCSSGVEANCNDGNLCTDDSCESATGCIQVPNSDSCSDNNVCTVADICAAGECSPGVAGLDCDDSNLCTDDSCDPSNGCLHIPNAIGCEDGSACTVDDMCSNGGCISGGQLDCNDDNPCTDDNCETATGCVLVFNTVPCDDGNPCTLNDQCANGACVSGAGAVCDDNNPCTDDFCADDGTCKHYDNQESCDDANSCTLGDHCQEGKCIHSGLTTCDDDNVCTTDSCDPAMGCIHLLNSAPCNDGDICTSGDKCKLGECAGGQPLSCNDGNPCTDDGCDPVNGCQFLPNSAGCDDGNACTVDEGCVSGSCKPGGMKDCNDDNPCTNDSCDVTDGCVYSFNTVPCDDEEECTVGEKCELGVCAGGNQLNCNDGDVCTDDACIPGDGCVHIHNSAPCSDGNACTDADVCAMGVCTPGGPLVCDDVNVCTADACDPVTGCVHSPVDGSCEDGNQCTENDYCADSSCQPGDAIVCDDGNVCTDDDCIPESGCHFVSNQAVCDDADACTDGDICNAGTCQSGAELTCDDANVCTDDSCAPAQGCLYTPVANYSSCGVGIEVCIDGACVDCPNPTGSQTFNQTGGQQSWTVPDCVTKVTIESWGAQGGGSTCCSGSQEDGGHGGYSKGELSVTAGETLYLYVGSKGNMAGSGGWNGGGAGGQYGGGGGGASDVRQTGTSLTHRVIVAGGGGGGNCGCPDHGHGGAGGGTNGGNGIGNTGHAPAGGGTQNSGGSAGENGGKGAFGTGHSNGGYHMAGGGGGWYGGGSAYAAGGGGGSGYIGGVSNASTTQNNKTGHGQVKISW